MCIWKHNCWQGFCCLGLVGTKPQKQKSYTRVSELDKNSLLKMHQSGMSLNQISLQVGANYKTIKRALINSGVEF